MDKVRQFAGVALVMLALFGSVYGALPWGVAVGGFLLLIGIILAVRRFSVVVWGCCFFSLALYLAAPFLWMLEPDYFYSDAFEYLALGCLVGSLVLLAIRFAVIPLLWPKVFRVHVEGGLTLDDIAPQKGKTVEELRRGIERQEVNFLFGTADRELVDKWGRIAQAIVLLSRSRKRLTLGLVAAFLIWPAAVFLLSGAQGGAMERDIDRMWETTGGRDGLMVSTPQAMNAARRVLKNDRALRGLTLNQAHVYLKTDRKNPGFKLGKPRYDFEKDETVLVLSDGRDSIRLVAVFNDAGQIIRSWPEQYMTLLVRDLER